MQRNQESDINPDEVTAYPLSSNSTKSSKEMDRDQKLEPKMVVTCKACAKDFDSTFSVEDFATLSKEQYEAGTLHLCPHCGNLSIYVLKDYHEQRN
ncbi:MAG: hypothetical protein OK457_11290 [Thaumarchaeota archaeon]|nr:hypothetical protein [Nitrososphaerota archaeon]